ncbi:MAG TPA: mannitol-1-phosphate 5-dehydrogenase [Rectinema sp.]|nr:mannitol-1-phosphate 5-dehydrogenase [Rectinema sp.]
MKSLVQFGAGNIGRSFIGQLFSRAGYEVVFIDSAASLVQRINEQKEYRIVIKKSDMPDKEILIRNVQALHIDEKQAVRNALLNADYVATSVGASALAAVALILADGIEFRFGQRPQQPIDIIIAENIRNGAEYLKNLLSTSLPEGFPLDAYVGLVETSIGKMVPIMRKEDLARDPLVLFAEEYNELIVDRHGFKTEIPKLCTITPVNTIKAFVDRKLLIHNLGHSAIAYLAYAAFANDLRLKYIWHALEKPDIASKARAAMTQAAIALTKEYPNDFEISSLNAYIEDLFVRFSNRALGDTIYRVGRDLYRKLAHDERIIGATILAAKHDLAFDAIAQVFNAALRFRATDEEGALFPRDADFIAYISSHDIKSILKEVCGLSLKDHVESIVYHRLSSLCEKIEHD